ncbi:armadillo-type protein [Filobasidium floriforme]|nr:armadillo-type protein [Filobasidium floriforme]KAH8088011.1 armadillo-type protein [Filobasidium floriforme]
MPSSTSAVAPKSTESWHAPSFRPEDINALISGVDRYNPHNVSLLEDYLDVQIKDGQHDCFANLAILKLYQFNPNMSNAKVVIDILLLALVSTPTIDSPDFSLAQSLALDRPSQAMLKQQNYDDEDDAAGHVDEIETVMPYLQKLWALLKECKFREFWNVWKSDKSDGAEVIRSQYLPNHNHAVSSLRLLIATTIASSFSSIQTSRLQKWLDLDSANEVSSFVEGLNGWTVQGDSVKIEGNGDNDVKAGVVKEQVELSRESRWTD